MSDRIAQLINIGREHYLAREYGSAETYLSQAATAKPSFPDVFNMLGVIFHSQGRYGEAEAAFEAALEINPNYTEAALNLSVTYNDIGKYEKARSLYGRVLTQSRREPGAIDPFAQGKIANMHADLGEAYAGLGRYEDAVREYSKALDLCPTFVDLRVRLGNVYRDMGMVHAALSEFERAKQLRPEFLAARINLGVVLYSLDRAGEAIAEWNAVLRIDPKNASASLYLRMVYDLKAPKSGSAVIKLPDDDSDMQLPFTSNDDDSL